MLPTPDVETVTWLIEEGLSHLDDEAAMQVIRSVGTTAGSMAAPVAGPLVGVMVAGLTQEKTNEWLAATDRRIDALVEDLDEDEIPQAVLAKTLRGLTKVLPDGDRWATTCLQTAAGDPDQLLDLLDSYQTDPERRDTFETAVENVLAGDLATDTDEDLLGALQAAFDTDTEEEALQVFLDVQDLLQAREVHETLETVYEIEARTETIRADIDAFRGSLESRLENLFRAELRNKGFERLTELYFRTASLDDPVTCWRLGFGLPEINAGYALPRKYASADGERRRMAVDLRERLDAGDDVVVLGYAGSGKSTLVRQVAVQWYVEGRGTVFHYDDDRTGTFDEVGYLREYIDGGEGHVLVVIEDAVGTPTEATYDLLKEYADADDVSLLLDSRRRVWENEGTELANPKAKELRRTALTEYPMRPLDEREVERAIAWLEDTTHIDVEIPYDPARLYDRVRTDSEAGEMYHLGYRLAAYLSDPLESDEALKASGFVADIKKTYNLLDELADDLALPVGMILNVLNAAEGLTPHQGLVHALAADGSDHDRIDELLAHLDGRVFFGTVDDGGRYRTQHSAWSFGFLEEGLTRDERAQRQTIEAFERAVNALFALVDSEDRRADIRQALRDDPTVLDRIEDNPDATAEKYIEAVFSIGEQRPGLAPLFGRSKYSSIKIPSLAPNWRERWIRTQRGYFWRDAGIYESAEEEFVTAKEDFDERRGVATTLHGLGSVARLQGDYDEAREYHQQSLELYEELNDKLGIVANLNNLGTIAQSQGDYDDARDYHQQSLEIARELGHRRGIAINLGNLGAIAQSQGDYDEAREYHQQSLEIQRELGERPGVATRLRNLGALSLSQGDYDDAREYNQQSLEIQRELGHRQGIANCLNNLGVVARSQGDYDEAREYHQQSLELQEELGERPGVATSLKNIGSVAQLQGDYSDARDYYQQSLEIQRELGNRQGIANCLNNLGAVARSQGNYDDARHYHQQSLELQEELGDRQGVATSLDNLGVIAQLQDDYEDAHDYHQRSLEIARELGHRWGIATSLNELGVVAKSQDDYEDARDYHQRSLAIKEELGHQRGIANSLGNLGVIAQLQGDYDDARDFFERSLELQEELGDRQGIVKSLKNLEVVAKSQGDYQDAREYYQDAHKLKKELKKN
jgi:tetratricopeptide (TPR) repeat protein